MAADVAAIVPAAGASKRLGGRTSKPFIDLHGRPLLAHTLRALQDHPAIRWVILVVRAGDQAKAKALLKRYKITKAVAPCVGGASRAESIARGFAHLPQEARWVLIHDAARPCASPRLIADATRGAVFAPSSCFS